MTRKNTEFRPLALSLEDLAGREYIEAACAARAFLSGEEAAPLKILASEKVDLYPRELQERLLFLLPQVGRAVGQPLSGSAGGATTAAFAYEELRAIKKAVERLGRGRDFVEKIFYSNGRKLLAAVL
jgi:hypothetical protein